MIVLDTGRVVGADLPGVRYDGTYQLDNKTDVITLDVKVTVPAGVPLVTGVPAQPEEYDFRFKASVKMDDLETPITITSPRGNIDCVFRKVRELW